MDAPSEEDSLLRMTNGFLAAGDLKRGLDAALPVIEEACGVVAQVILRGLDGRLESGIRAGLLSGLSDKEWASAIRVFEAGESAEELGPKAEGSSVRWVPLVGKCGVLGVLGGGLPVGGPPSFESARRLRAFAHQLSVLLEWECGLRARIMAEADALAEISRRRMIDLVSHELKLPLSALEAALEGLNADPAEAAFYVNESLRALRRLGRTVDNLLDVGRLETGSLKVRIDWCDIVDVCDTAIELTGDALTGRNVQWEVRPGTPLIKVDETLVCHALVHLLHNAAIHTPAGSEIILKAGVDDGILDIGVLDRGPGLKPHERERLFEKFFKGKGAPTGGAGLGLTIVRGFIGMLGGTVSAEDRIGGGAIFRIRLPCETMPLEFSGDEGNARGVS